MEKLKKDDNGEYILPDGFRLHIEETSFCVYRIDLTDMEGRSVGNHGTNLDEMVENAINDLINMRSN